MTLTPDEHAALKQRADAHGMPMAAFLRDAALGDRVQSQTPPDRWWHSLRLKQRWGYYGWLGEEKPETVADEVPLPFEADPS